MIFVIVRTPWPTSKGLDHPYLHVYACSLLWFMLVLASLVLRFATLDALSGFVIASDAYEAVFGCNHLVCISMMLVASCIPFPFPVPCDGMLTMLVYVSRWLYMQTRLLTCPCMSLAC